ncbi:MAG: hypothetical protein R3E73_06250 [Porticoccaceae bacterium]
MMKAEEGTPLPFTQIGLSDELIAENYFLTCQCAVYAPMTIRRPDREKRTRFIAMVREKEHLSENVVKLVLSPAHEFVYQAGQYTTLINVDGLSGDFPIASVRGEEGGLMEFHIANHSDDPLNQYIFSELAVEDGLEIQTALGDCYYNESLHDQDVLVVAVDEALASGLSLLSKATQSDHRGQLSLFCVQSRVEKTYFDNALMSAVLPDSVLNQFAAADNDEDVLNLVKATIDKAGQDTLVLVAAAPELANQLIALAPERCRSISVEKA